MTLCKHCLMPTDPMHVCDVAALVVADKNRRRIEIDNAERLVLEAAKARYAALGMPIALDASTEEGQQAARERREAAKPAPLVPRAERGLGAERVLLVEDERGQRAWISRMDYQRWRVRARLRMVMDRLTWKRGEWRSWRPGKDACDG